MPVEFKDLMDLMAEICDEEKLVVCFKETLKGAGCSAAGAAICGLLMGPVGFGIGGAIGGITGTILTKGKFQPVGTVLQNMGDAKWQKLLERFRYAFRNLGAQDAAAIVTLIISQNDCRQLAVTVVKNFLTTDLCGQVKSVY